MDKIAIEVADLRKTYVSRKKRSLLRGEKIRVEALKGVSFKVRHGEVVGLLGPNGAGKTTTIKILSTLLLPDFGKVEIESYDAIREPMKVRKLIGVMLSVEKGFYGKLTGRENLFYFGALYGLKSNYLKNRIEEMLELVGLKELEAEDKLYEEYSTGMKARLALARALLKDPPVLLLDEPTLGLDPSSARKVREIVRNLARKEGKAIIYTTHNMFEAEIVCDRILLIDKGKIIAEGTPQELKRIVGGFREIIIQFRRNENTINFLEKIRKISLGFFEHKEIDREHIEVKFKIDAFENTLNALFRLLTEYSIVVRKFNVVEPNLEEIFISLTQRSAE